MLLNLDRLASLKTFWSTLLQSGNRPRKTGCLPEYLYVIDTERCSIIFYTMSTCPHIFTVRTQREPLKPVPNVELVLEPDCTGLHSPVYLDIGKEDYNDKVGWG